MLRSPPAPCSLCAGIKNYCPDGIHLVIGDVPSVPFGAHPSGYCELHSKRYLLAQLICACKVLAGVETEGEGGGGRKGRGGGRGKGEGRGRGLREGEGGRGRGEGRGESKGEGVVEGGSCQKGITTHS